MHTFILGSPTFTNISILRSQLSNTQYIVHDINSSMLSNIITLVATEMSINWGILNKLWHKLWTICL